ncbi:uncharacterized protein LOC144773772 [Lissotriton helveticus]
MCQGGLQELQGVAGDWNVCLPSAPGGVRGGKYSTTGIIVSSRNTGGGGSASVGADGSHSSNSEPGGRHACCHAACGSSERCPTTPGGDSVNFGSSSLVLAPSSAIAWHVPLEMREKIHIGEFVNVFKLINTGVVPSRPKTTKESEFKPKTEWVEWSLRNWVTWFSIYAAILTEKTPALAPQLFGYMSLIHGAASEFQGSAWMQYDTKFRQMKAVRPEIAWDQREINIWHAEFNMAHTSLGDTKLACWQYSKKKCSKGTACKFKHYCSFCGGQGHPEFKCFRKRGKQREHTPFKSILPKH